MSIGPWQIIIIIALILIIFGRGKISGFMADLGKGITSFKKGLKEGDEEKSETPKKVAGSSAKKPAAKKKTSAKKT